MYTMQLAPRTLLFQLTLVCITILPCSFVHAAKQGEHYASDAQWDTNAPSSPYANSAHTSYRAPASLRFEASAPSRVIYNDEDPIAARLAWLRGRSQLREPDSRFKYIEQRLSHPEAGAEEERVENRERPMFTFSAAETSTDAAATHDGLPTKGVRDKGIVAERASGRRRPRFNEGGYRQGDSRAQGGNARAGVGTARIEARPQPPPPPRAWQHEAMSQHNGWRDPSFSDMPDRHDASSLFRQHSPTWLALEEVASQLEAVRLAQQARVRGSTQYAPHVVLSDEYNVAHHHRGSSPGSPVSPYAGAWEEFGASTPRVPSGALQVAPYRMWSVKAALPHINIHLSQLSDMPVSHGHWQGTLDALRKHEWTDQLAARVQWAADHRIESSRPARVVTPFGGVIGGQIETGASAHFVWDAADPPPRLDSVMLTNTQRRIHAWRELARLVPPALTAHSEDVYAAHANTDYAQVDKDLHDAVHPIQYISQMLRDKNAAIILENAIHDELHQDVRLTPPEAITHLQKIRHYNGAKRDATLEQLLNTRYATHNRFWYPYYHSKPAFHIINPLETPLDRFAAFAPWADAVALKKV